MKQKLEVKQIAGIGEDEGYQLDGVDLDDDFNPQEYDTAMKQVFSEKYNNAEDVDPDFGSHGEEEGGEIEKPYFKKEDELLGLQIDWENQNPRMDS